MLISIELAYHTEILKLGMLLIITCQLCTYFFITMTTLSENSIITNVQQPAMLASYICIVYFSWTSLVFIRCNSDPENLKHDVSLNEGMYTQMPYHFKFPCYAPVSKVYFIRCTVHMFYKFPGQIYCDHYCIFKHQQFFIFNSKSHTVAYF